MFSRFSPMKLHFTGKITVRLIGRHDNILRVRELDAIDGSVVIEIKPYIPGNNSATDATMPDWVKIEKRQ
jgi:tRNA (adenine37-N6)-methyltransferase